MIVLSELDDAVAHSVLMTGVKYQQFGFSDTAGPRYSLSFRDVTTGHWGLKYTGRSNPLGPECKNALETTTFDLDCGGAREPMKIRWWN